MAISLSSAPLPRPTAPLGRPVAFGPATGPSGRSTCISKAPGGAIIF